MMSLVLRAWKIVDGRMHCTLRVGSLEFTARRSPILNSILESKRVFGAKNCRVACERSVFAR